MPLLPLHFFLAIKLLLFGSCPLKAAYGFVAFVWCIKGIPEMQFSVFVDLMMISLIGFVVSFYL